MSDSETRGGVGDFHGLRAPETDVPRRLPHAEPWSGAGSGSGSAVWAGTWAGTQRPFDGPRTGPHLGGTGARAGAAPPTPCLPSFPPVRAADELRLNRGEFELAAELGLIASTPGHAGAARAVPAEEITRLRSAPGFPEVLRERVRTVGTAEGAALLGIAATRFSRLARLGLLVPVRFYLNRYRAVVWIYRAEELRDLAADRPELLDGPLPGLPRPTPDRGQDLRPATWRQRRRDCLHRTTSDPWERAAVLAAQLGPATVAGLVPDPSERDHLYRLRPPHRRNVAPGSPTAEVIDRLTVADSPEERATVCIRFGRELAAARALRRVPRPGVPGTTGQDTAGPGQPPPAPSLPPVPLPVPPLPGTDGVPAGTRGAGAGLGAGPRVGGGGAGGGGGAPVTVRCCRGPLRPGELAPPCCVLRDGAPEDGRRDKRGGRLRTWLRPARGTR